ncbi:c-type cytochrome biogenesis protein CcsB [bacterium]|nr:MAG: c-type cytochrome biogenesis protein CcsB [bacterium]
MALVKPKRIMLKSKNMASFESILSRDSYLLSLELRVFWLIAFAYGFAFLFFLFHLITGKTAIGKTAQTVFGATATAHVILIVFRTFEAGRAPFQTLYESLSWFACTAAVAYLYASRSWKEVYLPGVFVSAISLGAVLYALLARSPSVDPLSPALRSYWFEWHVAFAFFSYAVFVVSAAVEVSFLIVNSALKRGRTSCLGFTSDMIDAFHSKAFNLVVFGYPLLTFTIFSGAAWANEAWGKYWSWDPKETWSLITWVVFTIYLHSKATKSLQGLPASVFNLIGFICMMMTFLGVNWLAKLMGIPSLHTYAV